MWCAVQLWRVVSHSTETGESMGKFGAAVGSGAAKLGKKAAQSEAGRSAGRAAISGAADAAKDDLTNRYFGEGSGGSKESSPAPAPASQPKPSKPASTSVSTQSSHAQTTPTATRSEPRPPKPSVLNRFKPHIGKSKTSAAQRPVRQASRKERVFKYNLSREADWDKRLNVQALYNFKSEQRSDLEFRRGQMIQVMTRTDTQFDWWEGQLEGRVGIFPANYVKIVRD